MLAVPSGATKTAPSSWVQQNVRLGGSCGKAATRTRLRCLHSTLACQTPLLLQMAPACRMPRCPWQAQPPRQALLEVAAPCQRG